MTHLQSLNLENYINDQVNFNCLIPFQYDFVETGLNRAVRLLKAMYIDKIDLNT